MFSLRLLVALGLAVLSASATASAAPRPRLTLALPDADAGAPAAYSWTATNARAGSVVLQRAVGTGGVWRTIGRLHGASGHGSLSALPLGGYRLRIANIGPKPRRKLWAQQQRTLRVFGAVPLASLLDHAESGVFTSSTGTFGYVKSTLAYANPGSGIRLTNSHNYCRSVHLDFAVGVDQYGRAQGAAKVTVLQEAADAVVATVAPQASGSLDATVMPGRSWSVTFATANLDTASYLPVYLNGSANCYSARVGLVSIHP